MTLIQITGAKKSGGARARRTILRWLRRAASPLARRFPLGLLLLVASCARVPTVRPPETPAPPSASVNATTAPTTNSPTEMAIEVTSEPAGAMILVNDRPSGRTPLRVAVKTTPQGFCADYLTIKARFVASDASQVSQTTEADLTPREKAPRELVFTPQGVQRHLR